MRCCELSSRCNIRLTSRRYLCKAAMCAHRSSMLRVAVVCNARSVCAGEEIRESIQGWCRAFEPAPVRRRATMHETCKMSESSAGKTQQRSQRRNKTPVVCLGVSISDDVARSVVVLVSPLCACACLPRRARWACGRHLHTTGPRRQGPVVCRHGMFHPI